jgi:hypothetical protein
MRTSAKFLRKGIARKIKLISCALIVNNLLNNELVSEYDFLLDKYYIKTR